ncbi:MAG: DoxX family protein [Nitrospirales bacterium]
MFTLTQLAQLAVAACVVYVWTFCLKTLIKEFKQFGLSEQIRSIIGVIKIALATMLVLNVWYPTTPVLWPAMAMGLLMVAAQYFHYKGKTPMIKRVPSLVLLVLCVYISLSVSGKI